MNIKVKRVDESEGRVEFEGAIVISWETKSNFEKELQELIEKYAI